MYGTNPIKLPTLSLYGPTPNLVDSAIEGATPTDLKIDAARK